MTATKTTPKTNTPKTNTPKPSDSGTLATYVFTKNTKDLNKAIKDIAITGTKLDVMIQCAAMSCVYQSIKNRNADPAMNLIQAMPKGSRVKAVIAFMADHGNLGNPKDSKGNPDDLKLKFQDKDIKTLTQDIEDAMTKIPWWEHKHNDTTVKPFDFKKALGIQLKKAQKALEGKANGEEHAMTLEEYEAFVVFCCSQGVSV